MWIKLVPQHEFAQLDDAATVGRDCAGPQGSGFPAAVNLQLAENS